jgi:carboxymethylenebutenolidase
MLERQLTLQTRDGAMSTFICHPERAGNHPVLLFFMDAPGIREELRDMARRLGTVGYYVMLPNLYYRAGVEELGSTVGEQNAATRTRALELMTTIDVPMVAADTDALLAFAAHDAHAGRGPAGCVGYCMSGRYAIAAAARLPRRVGAAASIYGTALVTDTGDSPHLLAGQASAPCYFACAEHDTYMPPDRVAVLQSSLRDAAHVEVEVYPGVHHGFAFASRPVYDKAAAERHWERLFHLFGTALRGA